jgi:hypothetical protein
MLRFTQRTSENRFENMLRAFALPQREQSDPKWGGQGRPHHIENKLRKGFKKTLKPGGRLCIDESMFSWLGWACFKTAWKEDHQEETPPHRP